MIPVTRVASGPNGHLDFPGVGQAFMIRRPAGEKGGKPTCRLAFAVTGRKSADADADAAQGPARNCGHRKINVIHRIPDETRNGDKARIGAGKNQNIDLPYAIPAIERNIGNGQKAAKG